MRRATTLVFLSCWLALPAVAQTTDYSTVGLESLSSEIRGIVECRDDLALSFAVSGLIEETLVTEGQQVEAGQTLMQLDRDIEAIEVQRRHALWQSQADLEAAQARLDVGIAQLASGQKVFDSARGISREELQNRQLAHDLAMSEVTRLTTQKHIEKLDFETAQQALKRRTVIAPTQGIVSEIIRRTGESAQANDPVLQLCDTSKLYFVANLPSQRAEQLSNGLDVVLFNSGRQETFAGQISFVSPVIDPASGLRRIKALVIDTPIWLSPGTSAVLRPIDR